MSLFVVIAIALFFFLSGCIKCGIFIAQTPALELPSYLDGLLVCARPLAVAAVLLVLIDIRLDRRHVATPAEEDILEAPLERGTAPQSADAHKEQKASYFRLDGQDLPPSRPFRSDPQPEDPKSETSSPFATPPPFQKTVPQSQSSAESDHQPKSPEPSPEKQEQAEGLNFFKL